MTINTDYPELTTEIVEFATTQLSRSFDDVPSRDIVEVYNKLAVILGETRIKKFATKSAGETRVLKIANKVVQLSKSQEELPMTEVQTETTETVVVKEKKERKPRKPSFGAMYSFGRQKALLALIKSDVVVDGQRATIRVVGKNGDDGLSRDRIVVLVKGTKESIATISVALGEDGIRTYVTDTQNIVLSNDDVEAIVQIKAG